MRRALPLLMRSGAFNLMNPVEEYEAQLRAQVEHTREQLGYALSQVAELRRRIPSGAVTQAAAPGSNARQPDPLARLFAAIRPPLAR
jgi:hypothetical protein